MTDTPELLPCPFCGGGGGAVVQYAPASSTFVARINCVRCHLCMMEPRGQDVRELWNRRSPSAAYAAGAKEMRERAAARAKAMFGDAISGAVACHDEMSDYEMQAAAKVAALPLPPFDREVVVDRMARAICVGACSRMDIAVCDEKERCEECRLGARAALSALMGER